jgi:hypothetical protein
MADIARKPPQNLDGFMKKVEKYINQEETLRALLGSEQNRPSTTEQKKKKKDPRREGRKRVPEEEEARPKQDQESLRGRNWTPLNAPIMDVLLEIKRDPMYRKPRPVLVNPNSPYADQYCAFHDTTGHRTEACISLRLLIERFIENGSLSVSSQIKEFNRIQGTATAPKKTTIGSIRIETILGMTEKEIRKGKGTRTQAGPSIRTRKKQEPSQTSTTRKPSRDTDDFWGFRRRRRV